MKKFGAYMMLACGALLAATALFGYPLATLNRYLDAFCGILGVFLGLLILRGSN
jgi:hypothetical protein